MFGIRTFTASLFLAAATFAAAATPEYFPLQQGNSWAYRSASRLGEGGQTIEVQGKETLQNREYSKISFFGRTVYLRQSEGALLSYNPDLNQEKTFLDFAAEPGASFPVDIEQCTRAARVESKAARVKTPAGEWDNALQFVFEPSCADAGVTTMYFVPGVGPVVYETTSIAGPVRWELQYARAASTAAEAPQVAFTLALDAPSYPAGVIEMAVRLTLRNTHSEPVTLIFPSGQRYDLRIWNDRGENVYTWSANKLFPAVITTEQLVGERTFTFIPDGLNLPPGRYIAEGFLATRSREYVGVVGFQVTR
ncbi:MAG TPA: BsuPI-related putative proteinase inhibitor [Bryobacteraceae bacterium]|nr:BsuPI-related putative proteinase inhibitor [Bryobacteraceae bacterium]